MPEVEYEDRSDEPEWRLPSRTEPGIVGREVDENQHATQPSGLSRGIDDSEYRRPQESDWIPAAPPGLPRLPLLGFGLGVLVTGLAVVIISGDMRWGWIVLVAIAMLSAEAISRSSRQ